MNWREVMVQYISSIYAKRFSGTVSFLDLAVLMAVSIVWSIHTWETTTIRLRPIGPESLVVWWRWLKTKSVDSKQRRRRSATSHGVRFVLFLRSVSFSSFCLMRFIHSVIGTEGNNASAS